MGYIGAVGAGVAFGEFVGVLIGFDADAAFFDGQKLPRSLKVRLAAQSAAGLERDFLKLDILLQIQR